MSEPCVIVALDYSDSQQALNLVNRLDKTYCRIKVGKELFTAAGPQFIEQLISRGFEVFLDLKFHDIPNTVAQACKVAANLGVWMINVHASGGKKMLLAARDALPPGKTKLIAVTVLTSLDQQALNEIGWYRTPIDIATKLAILASDCGLDGVVCSATEAPLIRKSIPQKDFWLVTPGIRPADSTQDDQVRVTTPRIAILNGADYLVIGRPITQSADPIATLQKLNQEITSAYSEKQLAGLKQIT